MPPPSASGWSDESTVTPVAPAPPSVRSLLASARPGSSVPPLVGASRTSRYETPTPSVGVAAGRLLLGSVYFQLPGTKLAVTSPVPNVPASR